MIFLPNENDNFDLLIQNTAIKRVDHFKYLGVSDISVRKIILVTVSIQFGYNNFSYSSVTVIKKSIISVSIQLQLIN